MFSCTYRLWQGYFASNAELLEAVVEYEAQVPVPVEPKQEESTESVGMDIDGDEITAPDSTETSGPQSKLKKGGIAGGKGSLEEDDEQDPDGVNLDNILRMTGDIQAALSMCKDSLVALRDAELYTATCEVKVFILKALFESCCDTVFRDLLAANHHSIQEKRKEMKEAIAKENAKKRLGTKEVIAQATALCRGEHELKQRRQRQRKPLRKLARRQQRQKRRIK